MALLAVHPSAPVIRHFPFPLRLVASLPSSALPDAQRRAGIGHRGGPKPAKPGTNELASRLVMLRRTLDSRKPEKLAGASNRELKQRAPDARPGQPPFLEDDLCRVPSRAWRSELNGWIGFGVEVAVRDGGPALAGFHDTHAGVPPVGWTLRSMGVA